MSSFEKRNYLVYLSHLKGKLEVLLTRLNLIESSNSEALDKKNFATLRRRATCRIVRPEA